MAEAVTPDRARAIARTATARLVAMLGPEGRFVYRYALNDPTFTSNIYGPVRHIATVWGMVAAERAGLDVPGLGDAIARAAGYMEQQLFRPFGTTDALCVMDEGFIKLGGSALGVAAEAALLARDGNADRRERMRRLATHIVAQREADGDFLPARIPGPIARPYPTRDDFTSGQAILALTLATESTGEASWADLAMQSAEAFAGRDHQVGRMAHWMLYGLEALDRARPRELWLDYARRLAAGLSTVPIGDESMPIACMSEGLLAFARLLAARGLRDEVAAVLRQVGTNLRRQLRYFHPTGAFVMSASRHEVRIDGITHNVLGFLGYAQLAETENAKTS